MSLSPDVTYRVYAQHGAQQLPIKEGFRTREEAERFADDFGLNHTDAQNRHWYICVSEEKCLRAKYYEVIDSLLENARYELTDEDMVQLINDLGVVLDMHFDGIRREVEGEYDKE